MSCLFCKIVKKEIPSSIVFEDDRVLAFNDINPQAPTHVLVIPKTHVQGVAEIQNTAIMNDLFSAMKKIAREKGLDETGYRIVVNHGKDAGQAVPHLHFHLLGGRRLTWPPG